MSFALLFPGQGARHVLEGLRAWRPHPLLDLALEVGGVSWAQLEAEEGRALERTELLQPVLTALSLTVFEAWSRAGTLTLREGKVAGHSLGELAAASAAGAFDAQTAVRLAAKRGRWMADAARQRPGGLVALPSRELVARYPALELAAVNAEDEWVVGGPEAELPKGSRRVPVSGPWHTRAMESALAPFRAALDEARPARLHTPLARNLDGALVHEVDSLVEQLIRPVQFVATLRALDATTVVTMGPGLVLRGLVRRVLGHEVKVFTTETPDDLHKTIAATRSA